MTGHHGHTPRPTRLLLIAALLAIGGAAALLASCQSGRYAHTYYASAVGDPIPDSYPAPLAVWRPGDAEPRFEEEEEEKEHEADGAGRREMGPPPPGYWRIVGHEVPNWTPASPTQRAGPLAWAPIGPRPISGEYWSGGGDASGRVVGIAPHPTDPDTAYIASASGGVWKTTDGGLTWAPMTDELASLNYGAIAVSFSNPDTVIVATGEYTTGSAGSGAFQSDDAGLTWRRIGTSSQVGTRCSALAINPLTPANVHITSSLGYRRTIDAGATWLAPTTGLPSGACSALAMDIFNPSTLYVARHSDGIYKTIDGGNTFAKLTSGLPTSGFARIVIGLAASDPATLYAVFINSSDAGLFGMYKTTNGGSSWTRLTNTPNFPYPQGWYDCFVGVDPTDPNTVYGGGVSPDYGFGGVVKSTNGGASWFDITKYPGGWIHPDEQAMAFGPGGVLWVGCDGGVWKSINKGASWINCNATLQISQHYNAALNPNAQNQILGGTQDNGTPIKLDETLDWPQAVEGDGGFGAFDARAGSGRFYTTYVYLDVLRLTTSGIDDITGPWGFPPTETVNFIAPMVMNPDDSRTLLGGTWRVWRTSNADSTATWANISDAKFDAGDPLNAIAVAKGHPNTIYAGSSAGKVYVTTTGTSWDIRIDGLPAAEVTDFVISPSVHTTAYVGFFAATGGRIFKTIDAGAHWTDITGDLTPGVRVTALAIDWDASPPTLFAGTGAGIYTSFDSGLTWLRDGPEFPNVNIGDLAIDRARGTITAATYGRGMWRAPLGPCSSVAITQQPSSLAVCAGADAVFSIAATGTAPTYQWKKDGISILSATAATFTTSPTTLTDAGAYTCTVSNACGEPITSNPATLTINGLAAVSQPVSQNVCPGDAAFFAFGVTGSPAPTYVWRKDGVPIPGATTSTYFILSVTPEDAGVYTCRATNTCATLFSSPAALTVRTPVAITIQPAPRTVPPGAPVTFSVGISGTPPFTFVWRKDGDPIPGATSPTYTIAAVTPADAGLYSVTVSNLCGDVTSDEAALNILCPADLNQDGLVDFGDYLEFLNFFDALDLTVDFNGDGIVDFGDYLEFLNHFDAGC